MHRLVNYSPTQTSSTLHFAAERDKRVLRSQTLELLVTGWTMPRA